MKEDLARVDNCDYSTEHPPIYPDEHGDWQAANKGAARDRRPLWHQVADIRTDNEQEAKLRALVHRVEAEGGASELMTAVVTALGEARDSMKRERLARVLAERLPLPDPPALPVVSGSEDEDKP